MAASDIDSVLTSARVGLVNSLQADAVSVGSGAEVAASVVSTAESLGAADEGLLDDSLLAEFGDTSVPSSSVPAVTYNSTSAGAGSGHGVSDGEGSEELRNRIRELEGIVNELTVVNNKVMLRSQSLLEEKNNAMKLVRELRLEKQAIAAQLAAALKK